jgi:hypothetical protein
MQGSAWIGCNSGFRAGNCQQESNNCRCSHVVSPHNNSTTRTPSAKSSAAAAASSSSSCSNAQCASMCSEAGVS